MSNEDLNEGISVKLITPNKVMLQGKAHGVVLPQLDGEVLLETNHSPLVSPLTEGTVKFIDGDWSEDDDCWIIDGGIAYFKHNTCTILASSISTKEEGSL